MTYWLQTPPIWQPTESEYYASTAVGSTARALFAKDREAYHRGDKVEVTDVMLRGNVIDCAITEPERLKERYYPDMPAKQAAREWGYIEKVGQPVPEKVWREAMTSIAALGLNDLAMNLLRGPGLSQVCHRWAHPSGIECQMRLDRATDAAGVDVAGRAIRRPVIVDLKNWDVEPDRIEAEIVRRSAHHQMALYSQGFQDLWGVVPEVILVIVPPSGAWVESVQLGWWKDPEQLIPGFLEIGRCDVDADLYAMAECRRTGDWSNPRGKTLKEAHPPRWAVLESERRHRGEQT